MRYTLAAVNAQLMAIERITIGSLVVEKYVPDSEEADDGIEVKPVSGHEAKEAPELKPGTSGRIARGAAPASRA
jgi:hypothetical protein